MEIMKKPDCMICEEPESAFTIINGLFACASCLLKFDKLKKEETKRILNGV